MTRLFLSSVAIGFSLRVRHAPLAVCPTLRVKSSACGLTWRPRARSLVLPPKFECTAFADAFADASSVGMGGFVRLPDSRQLFFQVTLTKLQMLAPFPWLLAAVLHCYVGACCAVRALLLLLHQLLGEG